MGDNKIEPVETVASKLGEYTGRVKLFNNKGFGFITVISDGSKKNSEIFIHQSGIKTNSNCFRVLYTGEYVQFDIVKGSKEYCHQAVNVTGILGGSLMCEISTPCFDRPSPSPPPSPSPRRPPLPRPPYTEWRQVVRRGPRPPSSPRAE